MEKNSIIQHSTVRNETPSGLQSHSFDPASVVKFVATEALHNSTGKMGLDDTKDLIIHLKEGNSMAFKYYNYNIARELGQILGLRNKNVRAVYAHDFEDFASEEDYCFESASPYWRIHMIVWSERKTKALESLAGLLDREMVQYHRHMLDLASTESILDIQFIDDKDVENRIGYAAQIKSIHHAPICVWDENMPVSEIPERGQSLQQYIDEALNIS